MHFDLNNSKVTSSDMCPLIISLIIAHLLTQNRELQWKEINTIAIVFP